MWHPFKRSWFQARALGVLQTYYGQSFQHPLPPLEKQLLRGAVNVTLKDGGTHHDAAMRFYAAYAETSLSQGSDHNDINFGHVSGRMMALKGQMNHFDEHKVALKQVSATSQANVATRPTNSAQRRES